jgi:hypothetical protein
VIETVNLILERGGGGVLALLSDYEKLFMLVAAMVVLTAGRHSSCFQLRILGSAFSSCSRRVLRRAGGVVPGEADPGEQDRQAQAGARDVAQLLVGHLAAGRYCGGLGGGQAPGAAG